MKNNNFFLDSDLVLITGASSGIGEALTNILCKKNVQIAIIARDVNKLSSIVDQYINKDIAIKYYQFDLLNLEKIPKMIAKVIPEKI